MSVSVQGDWIVSLRRTPSARLRLLCIPYAGGATRVFRRWPARLPEVIDVLAAQLPGRERRIREPALDRVQPLVEGIAQALPASDDRPLVLFGHSMGAVIVYEVARWLRRRGQPEPAALIVGGRRAPHLPDPDPPIHHLPADEFVQELRRLNGTPTEVFESAELLELVLPTVRADFAVAETYAHLPEPPLNCAIAAYGGINDPQTDPESIRAWSEHTTGPTVTRFFAGDHFFLESSQAAVLEGVARDALACTGGE